MAGPALSRRRGSAGSARHVGRQVISGEAVSRRFQSKPRRWWRQKVMAKYGWLLVGGCSLAFIAMMAVAALAHI